MPSPPSPEQPNVSEEERQRAEEDFLAARQAALDQRRRAEAEARHASPAPEEASETEREQAEAEFLAERDKAMQARRRAEQEASDAAAPEADLEVTEMDSEDLLPPSQSARPHPADDGASCEEVLLAYYAHFEPSFATEEKVERIVTTFRSRGEKLGEGDGEYREKMFNAIAAQRDVHPLDFWKEQQQKRRQGEQEQEPEPEQTKPQKKQRLKPKPKAQQRQQKKQPFHKRLLSRGSPAAHARQSPTLSPAAEAAFSPRKSLTRTPPNSPPTDEQQPEPEPEPKAGRHAELSAIRIQAAFRGHHVRTLVERIADASDEAQSPTASPVSDASVSPVKAPSPARRTAWGAERKRDDAVVVRLQADSVALAAAEARLHWARISKRCLACVPLQRHRAALAIAVANELSAAVVTAAAQRLRASAQQSISSLEERKRSDSGGKGARRGSKRHTKYVDEEAVKVMRQVRAEVQVLLRELGSSLQKTEAVPVQTLLEAFTPAAKRQAQSLCAAAIEASCRLELLKLQNRFGWGLSDGDCVALMEDLLVKVEGAKATADAAQRSRKEAGMRDEKRAARWSAGLYEVRCAAAVRSHPRRFAGWLGDVAAGDWVRIRSVTSDSSGCLHAKIEDEDRHGWIALGRADKSPVLALTSPPKPAATARGSPRSAKRRGKRSPRDSGPDSPSSPSDRSERLSDPRSTQSERFAAVRESREVRGHASPLSRESSPVTRGLEDKLQALEAELGQMHAPDRPAIPTRQGPRAAPDRGSRNPPQVRSSWSVGTGDSRKAGRAVGSPRAAIEESWGVERVVDWLVEKGLKEYARAFADQDIDGVALVELERWRRRAYDGPPGGNEGSLFAECLRGLGVQKTGHVLRLCRYLEDGCVGI